MIEHIVLSGSGPNGLIQLGMLQQLINSNVVCLENIKSIHATSAGSIIGVLLCLHIPIQDIIDYFVHRPWDKWFKPNYYGTTCGYFVLLGYDSDAISPSKINAYIARRYDSAIV